ncbi:transposase [Sphingorhabdus contaminans]|uniref:Transposase n=1 Tax=Sphingorhabdus contaminans TaxID=1343899 RepID=A0A553WA66_9SPHN|nr:transposase [Sphingorhabdus contaminans]TSB01585.1 transposase [Sphingorhabdus contaminans]
MIRQRTEFMNAACGFMAKFGITVPRGHCYIEPLLEQFDLDKNIPDIARELGHKLYDEWSEHECRTKAAEEQLKYWVAQNEWIQRLVAIPGIGPVAATLLILKAPDPHHFRSGRDLAAWVCDRDTKYSAAFVQALRACSTPYSRIRNALKAEGITTVQLPPRCINLNAFAERLVRSIKQECLSKMISSVSDSFAMSSSNILNIITMNETIRASTTAFWCHFRKQQLSEPMSNGINDRAVSSIFTIGGLSNVAAFEFLDMTRSYNRTFSKRTKMRPPLV